MKITVLAHPRPLFDENSYVGRWSNALRSSGANVQFLTVGSVIRSRRAVVHIHWPEHLISHPNPLVRLGKIANTFVILSILTVLRRQVVWTAHNDRPHKTEFAWAQRIVLSWVQRLLTGVIVTSSEHVQPLRSLYPLLSGVAFHQIPLGSLALESASSNGVLPTTEAQSGVPRLIQFGTIDPYKEQLATLDALEPLLNDGAVTLQFVGRVGNQAYAEELRRRVASLEGATMVARYVPDVELAELVSSADGSLALQGGALNSGVIPASVPLGTPVISADTAQARQARDSLGEEWVFCVAERNEDRDWPEILKWAQNDRTETPVPEFDWPQNIRRHLAVYR